MTVNYNTAVSSVNKVFIAQPRFFNKNFLFMNDHKLSKNSLRHICNILPYGSGYAFIFKISVI